jgi:hypothetical protein
MAIEGELATVNNKIDNITLNEEKILQKSPQIVDLLLSLEFLKAVEDSYRWGSIVPNFTSMPPDMLTVILVLAMGALGGTIHLTQTYLEHEAKGRASESGYVTTRGYYLFRPLLGAITAFSVYILAKAGVLVISAPSSAGLGAELSPFFISFLGIISGLLAEQALDTIQRTGSNWFRASIAARRKRWAHGLQEALGDDEAQKQQLTNLLGVSAAELDTWLEEKAPIPEKHQTLIAAWLRKPKRDLFSDIGPDGKTDEPTEAQPGGANAA